jgi:hypothetical protein
VECDADLRDLLDGGSPREGGGDGADLLGRVPSLAPWPSCGPNVPPAQARPDRRPPSGRA